MTDFTDVKRSLSRRKFVLGTGTTGAALLAGCSGNGGGGGQPTETTADTRTATETDTPTETATETPVDEDATNFRINRTYLEFVNQEFMATPENVEGYNPDAVSEEKFAEDVMKQLGGIDGLETGTDWHEVYPMAQMTQYLAHEVHGKPIDPREPDSVHAMPAPMVLSGKFYENVVDVYTQNGRTVLAAEDGNTGHQNILRHNENPDDKVEYLLSSTTDTESDATSRVEHYDVIKASLEEHGFVPEDVDWYHTQIGKLVPDLYPAGRIPAQPQAWISESGAELLQAEAIDHPGIDPYIEMMQGFNENVAADEIGHISSTNPENPTEGEFQVTAVPQDAYNTETYFAPELHELQ
jgi:hypothetical protein